MEPIEPGERDQAVLRINGAWAQVHRAEQPAQFVLAAGDNRRHHEEFSLRRHRPATVASDYSFLRNSISALLSLSPRSVP